MANQATTINTPDEFLNTIQSGLPKILTTALKHHSNQEQDRKQYIQAVFNHFVENGGADIMKNLVNIKKNPGTIFMDNPICKDILQQHWIPYINLIVNFGRRSPFHNGVVSNAEQLFFQEDDDIEFDSSLDHFILKNILGCRAHVQSHDTHLSKAINIRCDLVYLFIHHFVQSTFDHISTVDQLIDMKNNLQQENQQLKQQIQSIALGKRQSKDQGQDTSKRQKTAETGTQTNVQDHADFCHPAGIANVDTPDDLTAIQDTPALVTGTPDLVTGIADTPAMDTPALVTGTGTPANVAGIADTPADVTGTGTPANVADIADTPANVTGTDTPADVNGTDTPADVTGIAGTPADVNGIAGTPADVNGIADTPADVNGTPADVNGTPADVNGIADTPADVAGVEDDHANPGIVNPWIGICENKMHKTILENSNPKKWLKKSKSNTMREILNKLATEDNNIEITSLVCAIRDASGNADSNSWNEPLFPTFNDKAKPDRWILNTYCNVVEQEWQRISEALSAN